MLQKLPSANVNQKKKGKKSGFWPEGTYGQ